MLPDESVADTRTPHEGIGHHFPFDQGKPRSTVSRTLPPATRSSRLAC